MTAPAKQISEARLRANRANALKSTGPRTPEGKARSARNATTHGLTSRDITALGEDRDALAATTLAFLDSWSPATPFEASLIHDLAALKVRLNRCVRMETGLFDSEIRHAAPTDSHESIIAALAAAFANRDATFIKLSRYESNLSRAYDRTFKQLLAVRKSRLQPTAPIHNLLDETNPMPLENKELPPAPEPVQAAAGLIPPERPAPAAPCATANRRSSRLETLVSRELLPRELAALRPIRSENGPNHPA